ncbi:hypothetical protein CEXT_705421 [Caerostris extrusa]|uniref:Uncharacterized protein n=1 Tax=Caerostris extrusa TaxID=172846 RepID=A0AAV4TWL6_CAEEX|nr:hypothetical protein CEXT_705421 [Caerostris extrusa]
MQITSLSSFLLQRVLSVADGEGVGLKETERIFIVKWLQSSFFITSSKAQVECVATQKESLCQRAIMRKMYLPRQLQIAMDAVLRMYINKSIPASIYQLL